MSFAKKFFVFCLVAAFLALPLATFAGVFAIDNKENQSVTVAADQIIDGNFIKAGNIIDIEGAVKGDVIVAGNTIRISGPVSGDVIAAGNSIKISGPVSGSVRVVGSNIEVSGEVKNNIWTAGSNVFIDKTSTVGLDVYAAGASVEIKGKVSGNVWAGAGTVVISNEVGKKVTASVDREGQVILETGAKINGDLVYQAASEKQLIIKEGAVVSGQTIKKAIKNYKVDTGFLSPAFFLFKTISFFSFLILGLVLISLVPKKLLAMHAEMVKRPAQSIGWGLVYLIITPVVVVLLLFTVIGIPLALIILPLYLIGLCLSKVIAGLAIGILLVDQLSHKKYSGSLIVPLAVGLLVLTILSSLPIVGWLVCLLTMLWALGAMLQVKKDTIAEWR
ncbi:MAG: hypothetical protein A3A24_03255 [Candidatus Buchananbacteria bacterium RIFCSPLOWO2_01_FULL_46_12]|uniref:DUF8173 domain-containing protein n=2 Tax=Candidatus Buchananiibacteriota TaxID=1817903 RepID=A0A1G1YU23_9BACT|nr:MAG: hypothetical protein A2744_00740 [Candidatus Buchananbacteria bacterium RIFCSPHIGHO2_01_FULL_44_11]OGY54917.1 MAG: hypothetical protein A3A24_03255 [Candidatus Buchananbacteria bacterium RIFCSPLOWO2_01_FULL_46_12]